MVDFTKMSKEEIIAYAKKQDAALTKQGTKLSPIVPGVFKDEGKERTNKTYKFKDGWAKTRDSNGKVVASAEIIKEKAEMQRLIDMGYHGLSVVEKVEGSE